MSKRDGRPNKPKNYGIAVGRARAKARKEGFDAAIELVREWRNTWNVVVDEVTLDLFLDSLTERKEEKK